MVYSDEKTQYKRSFRIRVICKGIHFVCRAEKIAIFRHIETYGTCSQIVFFVFCFFYQELGIIGFRVNMVILAHVVDINSPVVDMTDTVQI